MAGRAAPCATALLALLLAGCSGGPPPASDAGPAPARPALVDVPFALDVGLDPAEQCAVIVCDAGNSREGAPRLLLAANQTPLHLSVTLEAGGGLPDGETAVLEVDCDPVAGECPVQATARGGLPLSIDQDIAAPEGAILRFYAYVEGRVAPAGPFTAVDAVLDGVVRVLQQPPAPSELVLVREPIDVDGYTTPCLPREPGCSYPGGTQFYLGPYDGIVGVELEVTWAAPTPGSERLVLRLDCDTGDVERFDCEGHEDAVEVRGPSPLRLSELGLAYPPQSWATFWVDTEPVSPADPYQLPFPARQAYHVTGTLFRLVDPDATNQA